MLKTKDKCIRLLAFCFSVLLFFITLLIADRILFSYFRASPGDSNLENLSSDLYSSVIPMSAYSFNKYAPLIESINQNKITGISAQKQKLVTTSKIGQYTQNHVRLLSNSGSEILNYKATFDSFGRRVSPRKNSVKTGDTAIFVLGCSFVFGTGVEDNQTLPYYLSELLKNTPVINLGVGGAGPNDLYSELSSNLVEKYILPFKKIILIYGFIDSHLDRSTCSTKCFGSDKNMLSKPRYVIKDNQLLRYGTHSDIYGNTLLAKFFGNFKSLTSTYGRIAYPSIYDEDRLRLFNLLLRNIKENLSQKYQIIDSYQVYLTLQNNVNLINLKEKSDVPSTFKPIIINYSEFLQNFSRRLLEIPIDLHPTPLKNYITAESVKFRLTQDHPELF